MAESSISSELFKHIPSGLRRLIPPTSFDLNLRVNVDLVSRRRRYPFREQATVKVSWILPQLPIMPRLHTLKLSTPVFNSSSPWCSEIAQLEELYASPFTGAVTTRTATLEGFDQGPQSVHGVRLYSFLRSIDS